MKYNQQVIRLISSIFCVCAVFFCHSATAEIFRLPNNGDNVIGTVKHVHPRGGDEIHQVARRHNVGVDEILEANAGLSESLGFRGHSRVLIPSQFILPPGPREGIVINVAELRLYYYIPGTDKVMTEPVGIGRVGWQTPTGETKVISKVRDPSWRPTPKVRASAAEKGYVLPDVWPPGPDNPLGKHMMRLGWTTYLIHGTNHPEGVGKRSSAGCLRMYPEGIAALFAKVSIGTPVRIIDEPIKIGRKDGQVFVEVHHPLVERGKLVTSDTQALVAKVMRLTKSQPMYIKWRHVHAAIKQHLGVPIAVGTSMHAAND